MDVCEVPMRSSHQRLDIDGPQEAEDVQRIFGLHA
jgi:hypothetical protein